MSKLNNDIEKPELNQTGDIPTESVYSEDEALAKDMESIEDAEASEDVDGKDSIQSRKKKFEKFKLVPGLRITLMITAFVVLVLACIGAYIASKPKENKTKEIKSSYTISADSKYKVYLLENELFESHYLDEGGAYVYKLVDHIEVDLFSELLSNSATDIAAEYSIYAILEGYKSSGEEDRIIYQKSYELKSDSKQFSGTNNVKLEESVSLNISEYVDLATSIEEIIGGKVDKRLYISFKGSYILDGNTREFSYILPIPVHGDTVFMIDKPEAFSENFEEEEEVLEVVVPDSRTYYPYAALGILSIALFIFIRFYTTKPDAQSMRKHELSKILRKYSSRLVVVEDFVESDFVDKVYVKDMQGLFAISEEIRSPIFYTLDSENMPLDGCFTVLGDKTMYQFRLMYKNL